MCDCLEMLVKELEEQGPFQRAFRLSEVDKELWVARCPKRTKGGHWSRSDNVVIALNYCPICGKPLYKED